MKEIPCPWAAQTVDKDTNELLLSQFKGEKDGYIKVGPQKFLFPKRFSADGPKFFNFQPKSDDTWIITFPRSGTTLMQELVWLVSNDFNYKAAAKLPLTRRVPFLEFSACVNKRLLSELLRETKDEWTRESLLAATDEVIPSLLTTKTQRFIKTHIPLSLLHPQLLSCGAKVIYVARNPKDVAVSYFHLHQLFKTLDFTGTFVEFWDHFENDRLLWCPYWDHIKEAWNLRHNSNLLFIFYEEIQQNLRKSIQRIGSFLGKNVAGHEADQLMRHLDINHFRNNSSVNNEDLRELGLLNSASQKFIRRGGNMDVARPEFTIELEMRANMWTQKHLSGSTLRFPEKPN